MNQKTNRRNFLIGSAAMVTTLSCQSASQTAPQSISLTPVAMPKRVLGKTQVQLPILGLGGAGKTPISKPGKDKEAIALIQKALELGIRYFDTANNYGRSEIQFGQVLPAYRDKIYLNSKTDARSYDSAWQHLETSLQRLNTDYLDSWQLHHVSFHEELEQIFSSQGALKAFIEAKEQGLVRFLGITGHHEPDVIAEGLRRFDFDTTLISLNALTG